MREHRPFDILDMGSCVNEQRRRKQIESWTLNQKRLYQKVGLGWLSPLPNPFPRTDAYEEEEE
jgi:hypothetical protein